MFSKRSMILASCFAVARSKFCSSSMFMSEIGITMTTVLAAFVITIMLVWYFELRSSWKFVAKRFKVLLYYLGMLLKRNCVA